MGKNRFNDYEAEENKDYQSFTKILVNGGRSIEYIMIMWRLLLRHYV